MRPGPHPLSRCVLGESLPGFYLEEQWVVRHWSATKIDYITITILQFENINSIIIVSKFLAKLEIYKFKLDKNITCSRRWRTSGIRLNGFFFKPCNHVWLNLQMCVFIILAQYLLMASRSLIWPCRKETWASRSSSCWSHKHKQRKLETEGNPTKKGLWLKLWEKIKKTYHLFLAHSLAVGARASDVKEGLLLGGGEGRGWSADITPSGWGKRRGGGGLTTATREAFYACRGADRPRALA